MIPSYYNKLTASFELFMAHELEYFCSGYQNYSGKLYPTKDPDFSNFYIYGAPFRQFVSDQSVSGAIPISGVYQGSTFIPTGTGLYVDYNMGRVLSRQKLTNPTLSYSFKEFNLYTTSLGEDDLLIDRAFTVTPHTNKVTGSLDYNDQPVPCVYIKLQDQENVPFALGGLDQSETLMTCVVLAPTPYQLDAICGALSDTARKTFPVFEAAELPFNVYGDYNNPSGYNYNNLSLQNCGCNLAQIDRVRVSRVNEAINKELNSNIFCALIDFDLYGWRTPRKY